MSIYLSILYTNTNVRGFITCYFFALKMPAIIPKEEELNAEFLNNLKRKELQNLCKEHGIKAAGKVKFVIKLLLDCLFDYYYRTRN